MNNVRMGHYNTGESPDDAVEIVTPRFERPDEWDDPDDAPSTWGEWIGLKRWSEGQLREMGMRPWAEDSPLWLFPAEWFDHIPGGFEVTTITGKTKKRKHIREYDKRLGVLPFGIVPEFEMESDDGD